MRDDDRTMHDKKVDAGRASAEVRRENAYHPLFDYMPGENAKPIAWINVKRYEAGGPVDSARLWPAEELQTPEDLITFFGGGAYQLLGRAATPDGKAGAIVKTKLYRLPGTPKPLGRVDVSEDEERAPMNGQAQYQADPMTLFLQSMLEDRRDARAREERYREEERRADERRQARDEARAAQMAQLMVQGLATAAGVVTAIINRPAAPPGPDLTGLLARLLPANADPMAQVKGMLEVAEKLKGEGKDSMADMVGAVAEGMQAFAQLGAQRIEAAKLGLVPETAPSRPSAPPPPAMPLPPMPPAAPPHANGSAPVAPTQEHAEIAAQEADLYT